MKPEIAWESKKVQVKDLKPYERNPRRITKQSFNNLKQSIKDVGYHQRILANKDLSVVGGHQRIRALKELGIGEVEVLVPSRELSKEEFERILVQDNLPFGEFDFDILSADFELEQLIDWGMPEDWLPSVDVGASCDEEEDSSTLTKLTFQVTDDQKESIEHAIFVADGLGEYGQDGDKDAMSLARVCELFVGKFEAM